VERVRDSCSFEHEHGRRARFPRKGIKQIPRHQELYKKDFVFVNPAFIGPNLNELTACYRQIFNVR
jgi:hypothetical protein